MTAATDQMQELLDLVWRHLLPAFGEAPLPGDQDAALRERLARLALPPVVAAAAPTERADAWRGTEFAPAGGICEDQRSLTEVAVTAGETGWTVSLVEGDTRCDLRLGATGWTTGAAPVPTAVSGGWTDADTLQVDVLFLETPHRLTVICSLAARTFTARWHTTPLHGGPLSSLRAPTQDKEQKSPEGARTTV